VVVLGYTAMWSVGSQPMLRRNISPPSSGLTSKLSKLSTGFYADFLLGLFFAPEDIGDIFLQNVS
jgi:hypothetical protein